mgnify:CR=1 FL=1
MHPLEGPRLKVRRAESEIQALRDLQSIFLKESDYRIVKAEFNPKTGKDVYRVHILSSPLSPEWGVWIGEITHNLRSALDTLVYQLALLKTKTPTWDTSQQFPIFVVGRSSRPFSNQLPSQFEYPLTRKGKVAIRRGDGRHMIRNLLPVHQARIERLQPYKSGRGGLQCPLSWLKEVNNADKHRLIQVVGAKMGAGPFVGGWGDLGAFPFSGSQILKDGAKYGEAPRNVHVSQKLFPLVAFWQGCPEVKGKGVTNTLRLIAEDVSKIVESFAPDFD